MAKETEIQVEDLGDGEQSARKKSVSTDANKIIESYGITMAEIVAMTGWGERAIYKWAKEKPRRFRVVVAGVAVLWKAAEMVEQGKA